MRNGDMAGEGEGEGEGEGADSTDGREGEKQ